MASAIRSSASLLPRAMLRVRILMVLGLVVSATMGTCCYLIAGNSLDLFIGSVLLACSLTPPLAAIAGQLPGAALTVLAVAIGIGSAWILPVCKGYIAFGQWADCMMVLGTTLLMAGFAVLLLMRVGCSALGSSAIITILIMAWLTFPIWLSGALSGSRLRWPVLLHPLFVINGIVPQLGFWTEQQVAYGLTNLGQDAQYQLPQSAWLVIGFQGGLALVMFLATGSRAVASLRDR